jgi:hypothetical protein
MRKLGLGVGFVLLLSGCAKFPDVPPLPTSKRIIFEMTVAGKIRSGQEQDSAGLPYVYMVALRTSTDINPTEQGPVPVIASPWGNGFVAGNCTHFVWWNPELSPRYALYQFRDATLNEWFQIGVPVTYEEVPLGGKRIRFELDLTQLAPTPEDAAALQTLQVNFLTMDRIPSGVGGSKAWDALGDSRSVSEINSYINVPLRSSAIYDNRRLNNLEPQGDVADPDLDIIDWAVEVRLQ